MAEDEILKEIFNAKKHGKHYLEEVFKALEKIKDTVDYETPNSATFSMALDCLEKNGSINLIIKTTCKPAQALEIKTI